MYCTHVKIRSCLGKVKKTLKLMAFEYIVEIGEPAFILFYCKVSFPFEQTGLNVGATFVLLSENVPISDNKNILVKKRLNYLTLYFIDTHFNASALQTALENIVGKGEIARHK